MSSEGVFVHKCLIFLNQEEYKHMGVKLYEKNGEILNLLGILLNPKSRSEYMSTLNKVSRILKSELKDYLNQIEEININFEHAGCNYEITAEKIELKFDAYAFESEVRKFIKNLEFSLNGMIHE